MWTDENRQPYNRDKLRYPSDRTDEEWSEVAGLIRPAKRGGRRREVVVREVLNGIMYVLSTGCQWRSIPRDLPPRSGYLQRWNHDGRLSKIHHTLYQKMSRTSGPGSQSDGLRHRQSERKERGQR